MRLDGSLPKYVPDPLVVLTPGLPVGIAALASEWVATAASQVSSVELLDEFLASWTLRDQKPQCVTVVFAESPEVMTLMQRYAGTLPLRLIELSRWEIRKLTSWCASVCPAARDDFSLVVPFLGSYGYHEGVQFPAGLLTAKAYPPEKMTVT